MTATTIDYDDDCCGDDYDTAASAISQNLYKAEEELKAAMRSVSEWNATMGPEIDFDLSHLLGSVVGSAVEDLARCGADWYTEERTPASSFAIQAVRIVEELFKAEIDNWINGGGVLREDLAPEVDAALARIRASF